MEIGNQNRHMLMILLIVFLAFMSSMTSVAIAQETSYSIAETQITTNGKALLPDIYADKIVYIVYHDNGYLGDIYLYDFSTQHENLVATGTGSSVDICGGKIVWTFDNNGVPNIYMYDFSTSQVTQITNDGKSRSPKIYGDKIVYQVDYQSDNTYSDIYMYDISTSQKTQLTSGAVAISPHIYGDKIVWCQNYDIYMYNISTGQEPIQITYGGRVSGIDIYGDKIVWTGDQNVIHLYDLSTSNDVTIASTNYSSVPAIYKDRVVWSDYHDSHSSDDIFMYNISTGQKTQITSNGHSRDPNIFENMIVYRNYGGTVGFGTDVYMSTLTIQESTEESLVQVQGSSEVYLIENGMKRHFTSPEALEWNGYSFSDVIEISSETLASIPNGADISITQAIIDKYHALGGSPIFGQPVGTGELNGEPDSAENDCSYVNFQNGAIDFFKNGPHVGEAYATFNPFFTKWKELGYGSGILGYPIEDMSEPQISKYGTSFRYQNFANGDELGALELNLSSGNVVAIHGAIFAKWGVLGYANSVLGLVTSDERDAVTSFKGTTGKVSDFENGHLQWHGSGDYYMATYTTYGELDDLYASMGGTASELGFPIMDQITREDGYEYCEFEGGNIEWDDTTGNYKVKLNSDGSSIPFTIKTLLPNDGEAFRIGELITFHGEISGGNPPYTYNWIIDGIYHIEESNNLYSDFSYNQLSPGEHTFKLNILDSQGHTIESGIVNFKVFTKKIVIVPAKFEDTESTTSIEYLKKRADLVTDYYRDQSYGKEYIIYNMITNQDSDGWFVLPHKTKDYENSIMIPDYESLASQFTYWKEALNLANLDITIEYSEFKEENIKFISSVDVTDYDAGLVVVPVDSLRSASYYESAIVGDDFYYGNWAHELGHCLFHLHDMATDEKTGGDIGNWGLMGTGYKYNPPTPIVGFNKNKNGWLSYNEISYSEITDSGNEYTVLYLDDGELTEGGLLRLNARPESNVKYFVFEGRKEKDGVIAEPFSDEDYRLFMFGEADKGIMIYEVTGTNKGDRIHAISYGMWDILGYKVTLPVGESKYLADNTLKVTCFSEGDKLKLKIEPVKPQKSKIWSISANIPSSYSNLFSAPDNSNIDVDLHVITSDGKHIGKDYLESQYDFQVEGAETSGDTLGGGPEWISIPENVDAMAYVTVSPDLESVLKSSDSLNVEVTSTLTVYDEIGNIKKSEPVSINITSKNIEDRIPLSFNSNSPASITNLQAASGITWLNFTWINPDSSNFNHAEIYLDGIFQTNTSSEYFNFTGLQPSTSYTISTRTVDIYGNVNQTWINLTETTLPLVDFTANSTYGAESLNVKFTDLSTEAALWEWNFGDGTPVSNEQNPLHAYTDNGVYTVTLTVTDDDSGVGTDTLMVTVNNVNPALSTITLPIDPYKVNTPVSVSSSFTDTGILDTHEAVWDWGDGTNSAGSVTETNGAGTVTGEHTYTKAGIYRVTLTVTDDDGGIASKTSESYVVLYDSAGGFVTGGGWINSPVGAYVADSTMSGKATFEFASMYTKKATLPTGIAMFQLKLSKVGNEKSTKTTNLNFKSTSYDWLVVSGNQAKFKGTGTINGKGNYDFMISIVDGKNKKNDIDKFRIKIWDKASGSIVYDNQMDALDDAEPTTAMGGGSIVIHKVK